MTDFLIRGPDGDRRYVSTEMRGGEWAAMRSVAAAWLFREETARPGFREMIENIVWSEVR
ncbi:hypothetical protein [Bradyrhizobium cenepequi]